MPYWRFRLGVLGGASSIISTEEALYTNSLPVKLSRQDRSSEASRCYMVAGGRQLPFLLSGELRILRGRRRPPQVPGLFVSSFLLSREGYQCSMFPEKALVPALLPFPCF